MTTLLEGKKPAKNWSTFLRLKVDSYVSITHEKKGQIPINSHLEGMNQTDNLD